MRGGPVGAAAAAISVAGSSETHRRHGGSRKAIGAHDAPMPDLRTFEDFDRCLAAARVELDAMAARQPDDGAIASVRAQLGALHAYTRGGRCPDQGEKDSFNFGHIASRELSDHPVAQDLYELASFVTWWGHVRPY
jgi:hypothetical protein